ncbi:hypothetical protein J4573_37900 [Actinomadura barringtoniae]|uniref:Uncharacterized protein n=1 Tax=Actinomadura barringtoniae TaxID=1427535 RepID=A0A939T4S8_9ACTN|nr:hypothetical protein [Actinomadura barringtoniae]MBO2452916.1 hypothetical protein [Actinomadura barringtoniae]
MRRLVYLGLGAMVVATGAYLVVYLARWEWQRALMSGELLLVSLIVLLAVAGAHRLARLDRRLTELLERTDPAPERPRLAGVPAPASRPYGTGDDAPTPRFRWLEEDSESYGVFIPVLLGAGIVVTGLAALVERVASRFGRSSASAVPASLRLPAGGVLAGAGDLAVPGPGRKRWIKLTVWLAAAAVLVVMVIGELAERTQDRPDGPVAAPASTVIIEAGTRGDTGAATVQPLANRLWEYCKGSTRPYIEQGALAPLGGARFALVVQPALGEHALRRLKGCLQDTVVDRGKFRVVSVQPAPED